VRNAIDHRARWRASAASAHHGGDVVAVAQACASEPIEAKLCLSVIHTGDAIRLSRSAVDALETNDQALRDVRLRSARASLEQAKQLIEAIERDRGSSGFTGGVSEAIEALTEVVDLASSSGPDDVGLLDQRIAEAEARIRAIDSPLARCGTD